MKATIRASSTQEGSKENLDKTIQRKVLPKYNKRSLCTIAMLGITLFSIIFPIKSRDDHFEG